MRVPPAASPRANLGAVRRALGPSWALCAPQALWALRALGAVTAMAVAAGPLAGCSISVSSPAKATSTAADQTANGSLAELDALTVSPPRTTTDYDRDRFPHWAAQGGGCDTRESVLKRDGAGVTTTANCEIADGRWVSAYDNETVTDPSEIDIDHVVPLADAWRSGADIWDDTKREAFANDVTRPQLVAVTASTNRSKGDQDPSEWKPPNEDYWCQYARDWISVKTYWALTVTEAEKVALTEMVRTC